MFLFLSILLAPLVCAAQPDSGDTLTIDSECLVFYRCTGAEYDSLVATSLFMIDSLSRQFDAMKRGVVPFSRKIGIPSVITDRSALLFVSGDTTRLVNRQKFKDLFGVILFTPGRDPAVIRDAPTDVTVINRIQSYYKLK